MTQKPPFSTQVTDFIARLSALEGGEKARLKRDAGKPLAEASSLGLFYRLLPRGVRERDEETYFLVATLFPLADATEREGNFGVTLRRARDEKNHKGLDRRVEVLLDADPVQLNFRLRQAVRFVKSKGAAVNWPRLLHDLLHWGSSTRHVQKGWASAYFGRSQEQTEPTDHPSED
jgi:CRISPR system Cascade subunit CasB